MQILNSAMTAQSDAMSAAMTQTAGAQDTSASSGSGSASSSGGTSEATITANDFLTLLVTEMQNQDPTANTDPNEYINQLVQVNNLQQLISINQGVGVLDSASGSGTTGAGGAVMPAAAQAASPGLNASPAQAMTNFAAALRGEPSASPSMESTLAASARKVASAL